MNGWLDLPVKLHVPRKLVYRKRMKKISPKILSNSLESWYMQRIGSPKVVDIYPFSFHRPSLPHPTRAKPHKAFSSCAVDLSQDLWENRLPSRRAKELCATPEVMANFSQSSFFPISHFQLWKNSTSINIRGTSLWFSNFFSMQTRKHPCNMPSKLDRIAPQMVIQRPYQNNPLNQFRIGIPAKFGY